MRQHLFRLPPRLLSPAFILIGTNHHLMRIIRPTGWAGLFTYCSAAVMAAGMSFVTAPAQAAFELPEGEKITNVPVVPRAIPQKEEYELYDPQIGKNFDLNKFWVRGDLRVRPVMRNGVCFGSNIGVLAVYAGACNTPNTGTTPNGSLVRRTTSTSNS